MKQTAFVKIIFYNPISTKNVTFAFQFAKTDKTIMGSTAKYVCIILIVIALCGNLAAQTPTKSSIQADSAIIEQLDKLMNSWYAKKALYQEKSQTPSKEPVMNTEQEDSVMMIRLKALTDKTVFPMVFNEEIRNYIRLYLNRKSQVSILLGLAKYYFPMFEEILDKYGCPVELRYLAVIESALNPNAVSRAGATGLWQFMYNTGKMYGLEVNTLLDYRRDPLRATDAAARHLKDLSETFMGDWVLAMAAYNCGAGNVKKAILRSGGKFNFWEIYRYLPKETRGYIPAFYGAWYAMSYYDKYGITDTKAKFGQVDTVHIDQKIHFMQISDVIGIPLDELKALNPQYKKNIIPVSNDTMSLILPVSYINKFLLEKDSICNYQRDSFFNNAVVAESIFNNGKTITVNDSCEYRMEARYHIVKAGESLSIIARKYGTNITELAHLNKISINTTIHPNQKLLVGYRKIPVPKPVVTPKDSTNTPPLDSLVTSSPDSANIHPSAP
ncbi:MAG: transglycosylase SLT domain-containing protein [Bacteroidales bacterium]|nr:transglycosylase SLT domain-containing protein [Bacteroidales bacterium]